MKNKATLVIAFLLLIIGGLVGYIAAKKTPDNNTATTQSTPNKDAASHAPTYPNEKHESAMLDMAIAKIKKTGLYAKEEDLNCLSIGFDGEDNSFVNIEIRESHNPANGCGGDPETSPIRDRFRVAKNTNQVFGGLFDEKLVDRCYVLEYKLDSNSFTNLDKKPNYSVATQGRTNFYSAPDNSCQTDSFIVTGDKFVASYEYKGFIKGSYLNPKTKKETTGWILSDALMAQ